MIDRIDRICFIPEEDQSIQSKRQKAKFLPSQVVKEENFHHFMSAGATEKSLQCYTTHVLTTLNLKFIQPVFNTSYFHNHLQPYYYYIDRQYTLKPSYQQSARLRQNFTEFGKLQQQCMYLVFCTKGWGQKQLLRNFIGGEATLPYSLQYLKGGGETKFWEGGGE